DLGPQGSRFSVPGFPPVHLQLIGTHQVANALAALAVARHLKRDPAAVVAALEAYRPLKGRMEIQHAGGATLLVDHYNANPDSMRVALATLADWPAASRRIAILGDMRELGGTAARLHEEVGAQVRGAELWVVGGQAAEQPARAPEGGVGGGGGLRGRGSEGGAGGAPVRRQARGRRGAARPARAGHDRVDQGVA